MHCINTGNLSTLYNMRAPLSVWLEPSRPICRVLGRVPGR